MPTPKKRATKRSKTTTSDSRLAKAKSNSSGSRSRGAKSPSATTAATKRPEFSAPTKPAGTLRILSWNVNGLRSVADKGFRSFLARSGADVLGVQETRANPDDLEDALRSPAEFHAHFASAERKGYSGVGLYSTLRPDSIETALGVDEFDREGRFQFARFGALGIVNAYFPNGSGKDRDNSRIPYKLEFYQRVFDRLEPERQAGRALLVMGDFNTAHREIDLARPKENRKTSGFCEEERAELDRWLSAGWIDTFRRFESGPGHYSWWSQRFGVRAKNVGWRIDYLLASESAMRFVRAAYLWTHVMGSDHCPVGVEIDQQVLGKLLQ